MSLPLERPGDVFSYTSFRGSFSRASIAVEFWDRSATHWHDAGAIHWRNAGATHWRCRRHPAG